MSKPQTISAPPTSSTWDSIFKEFLKQLPKVKPSYDTHTIFGDVCRMYAIALQSALSMHKEEKDALEAEYQTYAARYGKDGTERISHLFALVVEALEVGRQVARADAGERACAFSETGRKGSEVADGIRLGCLHLADGAHHHQGASQATQEMRES